MLVEYKKFLILYGFAVYFLSLGLGFFLSRFRNARMALSAHVTGLMVGIFSIALAAVSESIKLNFGLTVLAVWSHVAGNALLVVSLGLAAYWNTRSLTPIYGAEKFGIPLHERAVGMGIWFSAALVQLSAALLLYGAM